MRPRRRHRGQEIVELTALADGSLAPDRCAELQSRVAASDELAGSLAEQRRAVALLQSAAAEVEAPASLRGSVDRRRLTHLAPTRRRLVAIGAAVAAVVAVVIGLGVLGSGTSAERFQVALAPTALAPGAEGEATLTRTSSGWLIALDASGLPPLANGRFYEAWLRSPAGVLVPIGTFNESRDVTLWAGVSPKTFTTLTVTRERADGNQGSSGEKVLIGTVNADR
jgi:hypothetical protein